MKAFAMPNLARYFLRGIGSAVCIFPVREQYPAPVLDHFTTAGSFIREAITKEGPQIRREARQMELPFETKEADRIS